MNTKHKGVLTETTSLKMRVFHACYSPSSVLTCNYRKPILNGLAPDQSQRNNYDKVKSD